MTDTTSRAADTPLGGFLLPEGFRRPAVHAVAGEGRVVLEAGRCAVAAWAGRHARRSVPYSGRVVTRAADPVLLVPGFMAGDYTLRWMAAALRERGYRTYRSRIRVNVGCTLDAAALLESRLESIAIRRGRRVQVVGHSLGGMLARGVAVRRPDLVSGIVTMGSPMLAPAAHHALLSGGVEVLVRLSRAGVPGTMSQDCVSGACARQSFEECRSPMPAGVAQTSIYSRRDGIVDWRACIDPDARAVEVRATHLGMAIDPRVAAEVLRALDRTAAAAGPVVSGVGVDGSLDGVVGA